MCESEVKSWLEKIFEKENIKNLSVKIVGTSEKGEGHIGDIVFVEAKGTQESLEKQYSLVLKCAKKSKELRNIFPIEEAFLNEIHFYEAIFPTFSQFQESRGIEEPFDKVPKCYGVFTSGETAVIALENLKSKGYFLWDRKLPLTRKQIDMMVKEYAKLHGTSVAMRDQEPERFKDLTNELKDFFSMIMESTDFVEVFENTIEELYNLLQGELEEEVLIKWRSLKEQMRPFYKQTSSGFDGMKVITHGDCWNNNFLHYSINGQPETFAIIDWQAPYLASPIFDLSYFLFASISEEDIEDLDIILKHYHGCLKDHLIKLGSSPELYPFDQFLDEWKKYCRYGLFNNPAIHKFAFTEKEDMPDMTESAERGEDTAQGFNVSIKNSKNLEDFKKRTSFYIKYAVKNNLF